MRDPYDTKINSGASGPAPDATYLFLHIFKTGGTSMLSMLDGMFPLGQSCPERRWPALLKVSRSNLARYRLFRGHFGGNLSGFLGRPVVEFTMLRDPIRRAISHYRYILRLPQHPLYEPFSRCGSLGGCLRNQKIGQHFSNFQAKYLAFDRAPEVPDHFVPWNGTDAELLREACARLDRMAYVGTLERMDAFVRLLADRLELPPPTQLHRKNVDPEPVLSAAHPAEDIALLESMNQIDRQLYAQADRLLSAQIAALEADHREHPEVWLRKQDAILAKLTARLEAQQVQMAENDRLLNSIGGRAGMALQRAASRLLPLHSLPLRLVRKVARNLRRRSKPDA